MIFMMTFFVIKSILSIIIFFVFELIAIVIIIIIIIIPFVVIIVKIVIILITFVKKLIAFRFDMIMLFVINAIFDKLLNDFIVEIRHNVFLKFNNNDIF